MNGQYKESTIPKEIFEAITLTKKELMIKPHSTILIYPKYLILSSNEDQENDEMRDIESNKEYKIGNYMVQYTLGQGTFGKVKLGVYLPNKEKVAIKILEKNRIIEKDDEIRVKREFDMLAQFNHPNVILVAEIFESEDSFYSVMEFCEGGELFNYIVKKNRLSEDEAAFFFYQLINGLEYIHSLGIVHRDLKPENLLLTGEHILKIIDFGLSNYFKENQEPLLSTPCGSPCYASPEMVAGKKYNGFKIDIWSCGIILYAMLCGYLPFEDPDNEVLFKKILECNLEFPNYVKKLSIDLIKKILVTDPEKRITIPEIKKHPFFLKGKEIFEQEFSTTLVVRSPKEINNEENENEKNIEEKENININEMNETKKEDKNDKDKNKLVEINLEDKENINIENINKKEIKKDIENDKKEKKNDKIEFIEKPKEKEENNKKEEKVIETKIEEKKLKKQEKGRKQEKFQKVEKIEKLGKIENEMDKEKKLEKIENEEKLEKIDKLDIKDKKDKLERFERFKRRGKVHYLGNMKQKDKKDNKKEKEKENKENDKPKDNIIFTEQEEIYIPLKTEYTDSKNRLSININENNKGDIGEKQNINSYLNKGNNKIDLHSRIISHRAKRERLKLKERKTENEKTIEKDNNIIREKSLKEKEKEKEINKEKSMNIDRRKEKSKEEEKIRQKNIDKIKKEEERLNEQNKRKNENLNNKIISIQENKKVSTPKKTNNNYKSIKSQRPSNLTNITKNINFNIKGKSLKYLEQKNAKMVSAKEPMKIKSTFKALNLNLNQYTNNPTQQIKGFLNGIQNYKRLSRDRKDKENKENYPYLNTDTNKNRLDMKDYKLFKEIKSISKNKKRDLFEEKYQRLYTEIVPNKNKNYLENGKQINYMNNTFMKNNVGLISDIKKNNVGSKYNRKQYDINMHLNARREKRKNTDIKRIKSTTFTDNNNSINNTTYNGSTIKSNIISKNPFGKKPLNRLQILTNKANNDLIYGSNYNYSNRKSNYESEICDNIVNTQTSSEFLIRLNNFRDNHFNHTKTNTNTSTSTNINSNKIQSSKLYRGLYPKKLNYNYPPSYFRYLNNIKKVSNCTINRNTNNNLLKNTPNNNDILKNAILNKDRKIIIPKTNETTITSKKSPIFTIRNTVINVNMIDSGLIIPQSNKKTLDRKKYNLIGPYNTQSQIHPTDKFTKQLTEPYTQKTYNNPSQIHKNQNLNNCTFRPLFKYKTITSNHCNNHSLTISHNSNNNKDLLYAASKRLKTQTIAPENTISAISSFNQLVTKMRNKQLFNKRHSNSVEKNNNIFKSIKLNDYYLKNYKTKNERKTIELNNGLSNTINNNINNKFRSINTNKNFTLPSLIIKNKKSFKPKHKRFCIQPGKTLRSMNTTQNTINENYKKYYIKALN